MVCQCLFARERVQQRLPAPRHAALHGAFGHAAYFGGLLIGKAGRADQDHGLALLGGQSAQGIGGIAKLKIPPLRIGGRGYVLGRGFIPRRLAPVAPCPGIELIAQYGEQPRFQVGAGLEIVARVPGLGQGLLRQIFRFAVLMAHRMGEGAQEGDKRDQVAVEIESGGRCRGVMMVHDQDLSSTAVRRHRGGDGERKGALQGGSQYNPSKIRAIYVAYVANIPIAPALIQ